MRQQKPENPVAFTPMSARAEPTHLDMLEVVPLDTAGAVVGPLRESVTSLGKSGGHLQRAWGRVGLEQVVSGCMLS